MDTQIKTPTAASSLVPSLAVGCGALAVAGAVFTYWLVVPGLLLGLAAIVLGLLSRRAGEHAYGAAAISLGLVALFLVPSVLYVVDEAESWGRDCALQRAKPDC